MGKIVEFEGLNEKQIKFVLAIADDGLSIKDAAERAGYAIPTGYDLSRQPRIAFAIQERVHWILRTNDAPAARRTLYNIMMDETASKPARIECAKTLLSRAGYGEIKGGQAATSDPADKPLSELTGAELAQRIEQINKEMAQRMAAAKVIEGECEPVTGQDTAQVHDLLD